MKPRELTAEQRRIAVDAIALYEQFVEVRDERKAYRGGMHWKKAGSRQYLIRSLDRHGRQQSLGPRSRQTEETCRSFIRHKRELNSRFKLLGDEVLYAYEMAAGVQLRAGLLQTEDFDALLDMRRDLDLAAPIRNLGFIGILRKVDKTFKLAAPRSFRAVNARGFAAELITPPSKPGGGPFTIGLGRDLIAEQLPGLQWLRVLPTMSQIIIAENGFPARFIVPDPRVFALHKLWLSLQPTRSPLKRKRDFRQGEAVAQLALDYLNLPFDDAFLGAMPFELASMVPGLRDRMRSRGAISNRARQPVGFDDD